MDKSSSLRMPMSPQEIFKRYKRQSLEMPRSIPVFITKVSGHFSMRYIFIASYTMCYSWSVLVFVFCFLLFCFLYYMVGSQQIFVLEQTHSVLIAKNTLVFILIVFQVFYFSSTAFSSCFSFVFCLRVCLFSLVRFDSAL